MHLNCIPLRLVLTFVVLACSTQACKQGDPNSELKTKVKLSTGLIDLTKFRKSTPAQAAAMKKEMLSFASVKYVYATELAKQNQKMLLLKKKKPAALTEAEMVGLWLYTSGPFTKINGALRSGSNIGAMSNTIKVISSAVNKLPSKTCTLYRGSQMDASVKSIYLAAIKSGKYTDKAFTSASKSKVIATQFAQGQVSVVGGKIKIGPKKSDGVIAVIKSSKCHDVSFQTNFAQQENLFPPGSEFKVLPTSQKAPVKGKIWMIYLQHMPNGTGGLKLADYSSTETEENSLALTAPEAESSEETEAVDVAADQADESAGFSLTDTDTESSLFAPIY